MLQGFIRSLIAAVLLVAIAASSLLHPAVMAWWFTTTGFFAVELANSGHVPAMLKLADETGSPETRNLWLTKAANAGSDDAAWQLYESDKDSAPERAQHWMQLAAQLGHLQARTELWQVAFDQQQYQDIIRSDWPLQAQKQQHLKALAYLYSGKLEESILLLELTDPENIRSQIDASGVWQSVEKQRTASCDINLEFVASDWQSYENLTALRQQLIKDYQLQKPGICWSDVVFANVAAQCEQQPRLLCQQQALWPRLQYTNSYLVVMHGDGKANVNNGVMYLPQDALPELFWHEFLHFFGFADEYQLVGDFARKHCYNKANQVLVSAPFVNLVNIAENMTQALSDQQLRQALLSTLPWAEQIQDSTPLFHLVDGKRVLGTPPWRGDVGLYVSSTCEQGGFFKPTSDLTSMEFYELPVPDAYWRLFQNSYHDYQMPYAFESLSTQ